jgi:hypothetical protein
MSGQVYIPKTICGDCGKRVCQCNKGDGSDHENDVITIDTEQEGNRGFFLYPQKVSKR